ncbi:MULTISPECIES: acyl-CoA dehydrogenase family protein [unclassified Modestobacter]|uniref:acyl-CoA dehydrogenase family protein n=1 Tax=unclassified Modestobacter TaxID=2643866 RepID=UPI0022AA3538|nr:MULTISPECIES: acyl-CoA dehydrogenase family protein [unclassified Modestobacter]MCZ2814094.1 acyl-CoA dehydrogenase family protein [Modestobacter sp. VKM Ac-2979]MCZ2844490.1 acyl-CoA dehydrogenase family protein [Modestobacter sp. VKM Ac-2980]MCZ2848880.1 acyl-CoA dehydrogenase family protein [Modestobacter sp. VKM Ac-2978]
MRLHLSPEDRAFRDEMRTFFTTAVPQSIRDAVAAHRELTKEQFIEAQRALNAAGLAVPHWPVEWGGRDWTPLQRHIWREEMQLAGVPEPLAFNTSMIGPVIATFGSQEQKERFLPATANLDIWWCQGFSEPDAGSDLASLRTTAVRDGDDWVVNGQKTWTTLGQHADWIFCLVRTDPTAEKRQRGISLLLFPMDTPGVTLRPIELLDGGFEVNEVFFEDVRVPGDLLVGEENHGWDYAKFLLGNERVGIARIGATKRMLIEAKEHARGITVNGAPLSEDPYMTARIAELENELLALELTALRVVANSAGGRPHPASSVLKLRGSELQQAATELLVDIAGPLSVASFADDESDVPEWAQVATPSYLNYRKVSIYGGSNEVQRTIIAGSILGL